MTTAGDEGSAEAGAKKKGRGFFALDVKQFERIRALDLGLEEAAAYLCLLVSTDQGNITSSGGIHSVVTYSGLSRAEARRAVQRLEAKGLAKGLAVERKRARTVPRYSLPQHDPRPHLGDAERAVVEAVRAGRQPAGRSEVNAAQRAQRKGHLERSGAGWAVFDHAPQVAFISNSFVRTAEGSSPLARLVNHGELGPLMLAAELYRLQNLMDERGIPTRAIRGYYTSDREVRDVRVGQHRIYRLYPGREVPGGKAGETGSFDRAAMPSEIWHFDQDRFWEDLRALEGAHVVEWSVYSANGKPAVDRYAFNRPQRPLGVLRNGRHVLSTPESRPAFMAHLIGLLAEGAGQLPQKDLPALIEDWRAASPILALENQSVAHVEGVGILRMTHRAATENTTVWFRELCQECEQALFEAEQVIRATFPQLSDFAREFRERGNLGDAISM